MRNQLNLSFGNFNFNIYFVKLFDFNIDLQFTKFTVVVLEVAAKVYLLDYLALKFVYNSPSCSTSVKIYHKVCRPQFSVRGIRVRYKFDQKINGAFSLDFDAGFLDRQKALEASMNDINNSFGNGSIIRLGSAGVTLGEAFPSGCSMLDFALGGGLPKGRIVEIYGPESSEKISLDLHAIA
ncbi:hypothetical protein T459_25168 [Capsicum annuum]|uniref:RecA family profile 1 domain-containing protein n=1 Tax=Capsicum annuum TaxID=4072 RepID=A0A2G2YJZ9_CAPAN|nr:putative photosystem II 10 kDa polypeptide, chloroplastic [Capsicum annuum]PHT70064.1 hypothetical protein T459_25168 [Capsicum annuum]